MLGRRWDEGSDHGDDRCGQRCGAGGAIERMRKQEHPERRNGYGGFFRGNYHYRWTVHDIDGHSYRRNDHEYGRKLAGVHVHNHNRFVRETDDLYGHGLPDRRNARYAF
jgi:hypothetical protein